MQSDLETVGGGGLIGVIAFHSQWPSIRNGRTCCMLYTWMLFKRAAVGVTTSIITSAQKTATTRWRVNGDGPFQVSGNFSFLTGPWVSGHAEYFVQQTTLYVNSLIEFICLIGVVICKRQGKMAVDSSEKSPESFFPFLRKENLNVQLFHAPVFTLPWMNHWKGMTNAK